MCVSSAYQGHHQGLNSQVKKKKHAAEKDNVIV